MHATDKKHIAVLMGGWSVEREISLRGGQGAIKALLELGHKVTAIDDSPVAKVHDNRNAFAMRMCCDN